MLFSAILKLFPFRTYIPDFTRGSYTDIWRSYMLNGSETWPEKKDTNVESCHALKMNASALHVRMRLYS